MSVESSYYAIVGYDLTGYETDKFDDWKWTDEGEKYTCNQIADEIQFFYDPMNGLHLYFGYILGCGNQYEMDTVKVDLENVTNKVRLVAEELVKLQELDIIKKDIAEKCQFIMFEECY